jgi:uncharacterized repeat protein (TIGR03803 family)
MNGCGTVFKITPAGTLTTLHRFDRTDGEMPYGEVVQATDGNFYGTTLNGGAYGGGTVFKITPSGHADDTAQLLCSRRPLLHRRQRAYRRAGASHQWASLRDNLRLYPSLSWHMVHEGTVAPSARYRRLSSQLVPCTQVGHISTACPIAIPNLLRASS